jgi:hypothetical protein
VLGGGRGKRGGRRESGRGRGIVTTGRNNSSNRESVPSGRGNINGSRGRARRGGRGGN